MSVGKDTPEPPMITRNILSDREMVALECVYISLLHDNRDTLRRAWGL